MQPDPVLVRIGPISIYWYGVLIVSGAVLAAYIASKLSSRNGHDPEISWNLLLVVLFTGVIGARIYHIISSWDYYRANPGEMFGLQMSGFGIYGAVLGGLAGLWAFAKYYKLRFLEWADYVAPGLLLAQAIGRWGNFFNKELFGPPTDLPWGIYIPPENRVAPGLPAEFANYEYFHPTFFYESSLNFIGFLVLFYLARNWRRNRLYGDIFFVYGLIYPVIRFFIEGYFRPDAWKIAGVPTAQWVSIILFVFFGSLLFVRHKLKRPGMLYTPGAPWSPPAEDSAEAPATPAEPEAQTLADDAEHANPGT
jgi:phosphatidylglycerol:prolipoprotein diacylglycerol transferase